MIPSLPVRPLFWGSLIFSLIALEFTSSAAPPYLLGLLLILWAGLAGMRLLQTSGKMRSDVGTETPVAGLLSGLHQRKALQKQSLLAATLRWSLLPAAVAGILPFIYFLALSEPARLEAAAYFLLCALAFWLVQGTMSVKPEADQRLLMFLLFATLAIIGHSATMKAPIAIEPLSAGAFPTLILIFATVFAVTAGRVFFTALWRRNKTRRLYAFTGLAALPALGLVGLGLRIEEAPIPALLCLWTLLGMCWAHSVREK